MRKLLFKNLLRRSLTEPRPPTDDAMLAELAERLEAEGYDWIKEELGIEDVTVGREEEDDFKIPMNTLAPKF